MAHNALFRKSRSRDVFSILFPSFPHPCNALPSGSCSSSSCSCFFLASSANFLCKIECCSNTIAFRLWASCSYMGPRADSPCAHRKLQRLCGLEATHTQGKSLQLHCRNIWSISSFFRTSASFFRRSSAKASSSCLRREQR